jgi:hypothetical protein
MHHRLPACEPADRGGPAATGMTVESMNMSRRAVIIGALVLVAVGGLGGVAAVVANSTPDEAQVPVVSGPSGEISSSPSNRSMRPAVDQTQGMTAAQLQSKGIVAKSARSLPGVDSARAIRTAVRETGVPVSHPAAKLFRITTEHGSI